MRPDDESRAPPRAAGLAHGLDVLAVTAHRTFAKVARRPVVLTFSLLQPLTWMLFFGFLFARFPVGEAGASYVTFVAPGIAVMSVVFGSSQSGIPIVRDAQTGFLQRVLRTPASPLLVLVGKLAADAGRLVAQALVVLALGALLGARLAPSAPAVLAAAAPLVLLALALSTVSCTLALLARHPETMAVFVHLVNLPLLFTSTALVPQRQMPSWLQAASRWNPVTLATDAWRAAWLDGSFDRTAAATAVLAALAAGLLAAAAAALRHVERTAD